MLSYSKSSPICPFQIFSRSSFDAETAQRDEEKSSLLSQIEGLNSENEENRRQIQAIQQERDSTVSKMRQEIEQLHLVSHESKELADRLGQLENTLHSQVFLPFNFHLSTL